MRFYVKLHFVTGTAVTRGELRVIILFTLSFSTAATAHKTHHFIDINILHEVVQRHVLAAIESPYYNFPRKCAIEKKLFFKKVGVVFFDWRYSLKLLCLLQVELR